LTKPQARSQPLFGKEDIITTAVYCAYERKRVQNACQKSDLQQKLQFLSEQLFVLFLFLFISCENCFAFGLE